MKIPKILIIGDFGVYNQKLVEYLTDNYNCRIDFLSVTPGVSQHQAVNHIYHVNLHSSRFFFSRLIANLFHAGNFYLKLRNKYDIIHIVYLASTNIVFLPLLMGKAKVVISFLGSDLNIIPNSFLGKFSQKMMLRYTDAVHLISDEFEEKYFSIFGSPEKCFRARYGTPIDFTLLDSISADEEKSFQKEYGIDNHKLCLICGFYAKPEKQHYYIIDEILALKDASRKKIQLVIPLTYGFPDYRNQVIQYAHNKLSGKVDFTCLTEYLDDREVACLRRISDVVINLSKVDCLAATMLESIFAGAILINGSWLPYGIFKKHGIFDIKINACKPGILSSLIENIIIDFPHQKSKCINNSEKIRAISSWDKNIHDWIKIYKTLSNKTEISREGHCNSSEKLN